MTGYFIKATIIWTILLLVYISAFAKSTGFRANRLYLLFSLAAGIILPLFPSPWQFGPADAMGEIIASSYLGYTPGEPDAALSNLSSGEQSQMDWSSILSWIYILISGTLLVMSLAEVIKILHKAIYGRYTTINGFRIFESYRTHAPFSFMGWIFITNINDYSGEELSYILQHEHAHNQQKHWVDIIFIQLCCIVFWINPVVWVFRHLLKMQHEFEADSLAAADNRYDYGRFLLNQVLLKGTPSIAHSFHYSPIKNRINMLTKTSKNDKWKFLLTVPALMLCTLVMAKTSTDLSRIKEGNITTFKGNKFEWDGKSKPIYDSVYVTDPVSGENTVMVMKRDPEERIVKYNGTYVLLPGTSSSDHYKKASMDFSAKLKKALIKEASKIPDNIKSVEIINVVMDQQGKILYYDLAYTLAGKENNKVNTTAIDAALDRAISNTPAATISILSQKEALYTFWHYCTKIDF